MSIDVQTYALAKKYTDKAVQDPTYSQDLSGIKTEISALQDITDNNTEDIANLDIRLSKDISELKSNLASMKEDNSITGNLICSDDYIIQTSDFIGYNIILNFALNNSGGLSATRTCHTTDLISLVDLPDVVRVCGLYVDDIWSSLVAKKTDESTTGWKYSNLPASFCDKYEDYVRVNVKYLKDAGTWVALGFNTSTTDTFKIVYETTTNIMHKKLDWLIVNGNNRYIVKKDGSGDFATIQAAIDNVADGAEIYVCPGEYEENLDLGAKDIKLTGANPLTTKIFDTSGEYSKSPIVCGSGFISGLTFYSKKLDKEYTFTENNRSYAIHLDTRWGGSKKIQIDNCIIISDFAASIGCGIVDDVEILITNCRIIATSEDVAAFQIHGQSSGTGNAIIQIRGCIMETYGSNAKGLLLSNGGHDWNTGTTITIIANNNKCSFYNNCEDLFILHKSSWGNSASELNA